MSEETGTLAVIPARGGSQGLPGKNIRPLAGIPLIMHSVMLAKMCPEIDRCIISTDSEKIANVARTSGADVPFMRPAELADNHAPIFPALVHALKTVEKKEGRRYRYLMLLDPTSPTRLPEDVTEAMRRLEAKPSADGIISVSESDYNPIWHSVVEKNGLMSDLFAEGRSYQRRQDVPEVYYINGLLYVWRTSFARGRADWRKDAKLLMLETPESRSVSMDTEEQFNKTEILVKAGILPMPWLKEEHA